MEPQAGLLKWKIGCILYQQKYVNYFDGNDDDFVIKDS